MLTKNFDYWAIHTEDDDRSGSDKEFFDTLDDAIAARMNYANWCTSKGNVYIVHHFICGAGNHVIDEIELRGDYFTIHIWDTNYVNGRDGYDSKLKLFTGGLIENIHDPRYKLVR